MWKIRSLREICLRGINGVLISAMLADYKSITRTCAQTIISDYDLSNVVFWIGSGADRLGPTFLPTGNELTLALLENLLLAKYYKRLISIWDSCAGILGLEDYYPRLESVLEAFKRCGYSLSFERQTVSITEGLRFFDDAPSNENTQLLGSAILKGSTVITTNYSTVIENEACIQSESKDATFCLRQDSDCLTYYIGTVIDSNGSHGSIYHLHGVSCFPRNMGITLTTVSYSFAKDFKTLMSDLIQKKTLFIFFGYSGSDDYDVKPLFDSLSENKVNSKAQAIFIRYGEDSQVSHEITDKENRLLLPFRKSFICSCKKLSDVIPLRKSCTKNLKYQISKMVLIG